MSEGKSGLKKLNTNEVLFNDGDLAASLYIIQKGQLRLYKPKGKGFIEIAVLRAGEVIGEMAFFDEDGSGNKRSCAASAMVPTDVIEISFPAFAKTMNALNPWFKTIINTLASRLRKANSRIKELESNAGTVSYGNKAGEYEYIKPFEILKVLGTMFLVFKTHAEKKENGFSLHKQTVELYSHEIFQITESKFDAVLFILTDLGWAEIENDKDDNPHVYLLKNLDFIRSLFIFYNTEKHLPGDKRMKVKPQAQQILELILSNANDASLIDIPNLKAADGGDFRFTKYYDLTPVLAEIQNRNLNLKLESLDGPRASQIVGEQVEYNGKQVIEINFDKLKKLMPVIRFLNKVNDLNKEKSNFQ